MLRFLLDTDHLTLFEYGHPALLQKIISQAIGAVGISPISVEEALRGRLALLAKAKTGQERVLRYTRLADTVQMLGQFPLAAYDDKAEAEYQHLRSLKLKIGTQDLKIAAVTRSHSLTLLTRNRQDFATVPELLVEDWIQ